MKRQNKTASLIAVSLFAALVFIFTYIHIDIPTPLGKTMLHLGNVMCLLAGFVLGGLRGGLAAGFGSMFYDLFDPVFLPECWITFIMKFAMAFVAGVIANADGLKRLRFWRYVIAAVCGSLTYLALYMLKTFVINYWVYGSALETVLLTMSAKGAVSAVNGGIACAASLVLFAALAPALRRAKLGEKLGLHL